MPLLPPLVPLALSSSSQTRLDGWLVSDNAKKISSKKKLSWKNVLATSERAFARLHKLTNDGGR